jgi:hypothetical protein
MGTKAMTWAVFLALVGALVSACVSSEQGTSNSTIRLGARWTQDLNEPPPSREPASDAARLRDELHAARERPLR